MKLSFYFWPSRGVNDGGPCSTLIHSSMRCRMPKAPRLSIDPPPRPRRFSVVASSSIRQHNGLSGELPFPDSDEHTQRCRTAADTELHNMIPSSQTTASSLLRLPNEVLLHIFLHHSHLSLPDLASLSLVHPRFAPLCQRATASHPQRDYLWCGSGWIPRDILCLAECNDEGKTGWLRLGVDKDKDEEASPFNLGKILCNKLWDRFNDDYFPTRDVSVTLAE